MTEDGATTKWCPHATQLDDWSETVSYSRGPQGEPVTMCIASECMAWRWLVGDMQIPDGNNGFRFAQKQEGYCGLAGKP